MKTYCISDIHGHWTNFEKFINTLDEDDKVYVLGDVIDKGTEAIKCLTYIMEDRRFKMLLGNHEYMMYQYLSSDPDSYEFFESYERWVEWNSGGDTLNQYKLLPEHQRKQIFDFIIDLPLNYPDVKVNGRTFYLVHSCPGLDFQVRMKNFDFNDNKICAYVWNRVHPLDKLDLKDRIVVAGHTVVQHYLGLFADEMRPVYDNNDKLCSDDENIVNAHYIDIDGGLAGSFSNSRLISLCLDDLSFKMY